jgi:hypothetical protein
VAACPTVCLAENFREFDFQRQIFAASGDNLAGKPVEKLPNYKDTWNPYPVIAPFQKESNPLTMHGRQQ